MAIEAVAFGKSLSVLSLSMRYAQYEIPSMDLTVPLREIAGQDVYFQDIAFYRDGQLLDSGFIRTPMIVPDLSDSSAKVRLRCQNDLGRLQCELPVNLRLDNALPWTAIHYLLSTTQQHPWVFGDNRAYPLIQPELPGIFTHREITLDVSDARNLWDQLVKIGKATSSRDSSLPLFYRAGAARRDFYQLDMGYFGERANTNQIIGGQNTIGPAKINTPTREPIKAILPIPGDPAITLSDALNINPNLATHPLYPLDATNQSVVNADLAKGGLIRKTFSDVKPAGDPPNATQLNQAALALYYRATQAIIDSQPYVNITQSCFLEKPPRLHENIWFDNLITEFEHDPYTGRFQIVESYRLQQWMRIVGIKMDYRERYESLDPYTGRRLPAEIYELELSTSDQRDIYDPDLVLYDALKIPEDNPIQSVISTHNNMSFGFNAGVTHSGTLADCDFNGMSTGKSFFLPNPLSTMGDYVLPLLGSGPQPDDDTSFAFSYSRRMAYRLKVTQPASLTTSLALCASGLGGEAWDADDDLSIFTRYIYYNLTP